MANQTGLVLAVLAVCLPFALNASGKTLLNYMIHSTLQNASTKIQLISQLYAFYIQQMVEKCQCCLV